jgi:hypothetical protein
MPRPPRPGRGRSRAFVRRHSDSSSTTRNRLSGRHPRPLDYRQHSRTCRRLQWLSSTVPATTDFLAWPLRHPLDHRPDLVICRRLHLLSSTVPGTTGFLAWLPRHSLDHLQDPRFGHRPDRLMSTALATTHLAIELAEMRECRRPAPSPAMSPEHRLPATPNQPPMAAGLASAPILRRDRLRLIRNHLQTNDSLPTHSWAD